MAVSKVAIANRALQKLGAKRIEALTQDHPNARSMSAAFDLVRDAEIRRYRWGFAIKRKSIAADGDETTWGEWKRYSLPNDYLAIIRDDESGQTVDWRIEAGEDGEGVFIVTATESPLEIRYIARIEDPNYYDPLFIEAFACKLALETCEEITQSTSKKESIRGDYDAAIAEAKKQGAYEQPAQDFPEDDWILARL
jgi:hypothetical protein